MPTVPARRRGSSSAPGMTPRCERMSSASASRRVAVLGSTGSIGTSCLDVIAHLGDRLHAHSLSAHSSWQELRDQARRFRPRRVALTDPDTGEQIARELNGLCEVLRGPDALATL